MSRWDLLMMVLSICSAVDLMMSPACPPGFNSVAQECSDLDECQANEDNPDEDEICGENTQCFNTNGSFYCQCLEGFLSSQNSVNFSADSAAVCRDIDECNDSPGLCGTDAECFNTAPGYSCICDSGFISSTGVEKFHHSDGVTCTDIDECEEENICGGNATCINTRGSYRCVCNSGYRLKSANDGFSGAEEQCEDIRLSNNTIWQNGSNGQFCTCQEGFTNYGNQEFNCTALKCDAFSLNNHNETFQVGHDFVQHLEEACLMLTGCENPTEMNGDKLLQKLLSMIDNLLANRVLSDNREVSAVLDMVENSLRLIGPLIDPPGATRTSTYTEVKLLVHKGADLPRGPFNLSSKHTNLDIQWETVAGDPASYPGYATLSLLSYTNLEASADGFLSGMKPKPDQTFKLNSKIVTVTVSNNDTSQLSEPIKLTFYHLKQSNELNHVCVFWDSSEEGGTWSPRGCSTVDSNSEYTVCSCSHLSSFAVLMALYQMEDHFELQMMTFWGLSLSLICLFVCILTFSMIRSIQSPRTTIHLHLCISLFLAFLIFLTSISQTKSQVGCAVVAGLLHFFYLAAFCWMCLEGIQLFRMVVLVFNTNFKTLYMMLGGYGVPAVIVGVFALVHPKGYGTKRYCWLNLDFIWSFFGPVCVIITINIFFFIITVWKLAQKFSSLNPDLNSLQKIRAFVITAVAQLCVLGTMWIFGCFQFGENTIIMSYLFTIFGSLQGVMLFVMHCLFSKQVREEYVNILSRLCAPRKRSYTEYKFSSSSKANVSKSTQDTGVSPI
ncbi:CD97 antigen [Takifugu rubripes]|uniref:CD97 antigen-like n=1 Tax=Takifugu rubripes TaxID=31033 RepID=H2UGE8_TAKRU|nr:CD97 antigen-like [Takifugu rubripes]